MSRNGMAKTKKRKPQQTELAFQTPAVGNSKGTPDAGLFCPVYYPQAGAGLLDLARRLAPVLARTGWNVRVVEGEEGEKFLDLKNKYGQSRRLSPEEALAWRALLPQLSDGETLFPTPKPDDRKDL